jgi:hypothetical protein
MRQIDASKATVEWLEAHLSHFGQLSRHVPRTPEVARTLFLSEALDITIQASSLGPDQGYLQLETVSPLDGQTLRLLIGTEILCGGTRFGFESLSPDPDTGEARRGCILIRFSPF